MNTSIDKVLAERGSRYGEFTDHAKITQNIKRAMLNSHNWPTLSDDKKEALEMIAHKIGRILNGDPDYQDSWTDIVGYAKLVEDTLYFPAGRLGEAQEVSPKELDKFINKLEPAKEINRHETISTSQSFQSEQTKPLDSSIRAAKNWQDTVSGYSGRDRRVRQNNLG